MRRAAPFLLALLAALAACNSAGKIEADRKRFARLSASRPVGSVCSETDSASVTRAAAHPLGPQGGWFSQPEVDDQRTVAASTGALVMYRGLVKGYVRFDTPGILRARSYDDVYGSVYCGFSPHSLALASTERPVFVTMDRCAVGDGGLDQVEEACWFPQGQKQGVVVFSSAHPDPDASFRPKELYREQDVGNEGSFNDAMAVEVLNDFIHDRDAAGARRFMEMALARLTTLRGATAGPSGSPVPTRVWNARAWQAVLVYKLGLNAGRADFDGTAGELSDLAEMDRSHECNECQFTAAALPLYAWLDGQLRGRKAPPPDPSTMRPGVVGRDPVTIAKYLRGEIPEDDFLRQSPLHRFWAGVKRWNARDKRSARAAQPFFDEFLEGRATPGDGFERAAALAFAPPPVVKSSGKPARRRRG